MQTCKYCLWFGLWRIESAYHRPDRVSVFWQIEGIFLHAQKTLTHLQMRGWQCLLLPNICRTWTAHCVFWILINLETSNTSNICIQLMIISNPSLIVLSFSSYYSAQYLISSEASFDIRSIAKALLSFCILRNLLSDVCSSLLKSAALSWRFRLRKTLIKWVTVCHTFFSQKRLVLLVRDLVERWDMRIPLHAMEWVEISDLQKTAKH